MLTAQQTMKMMRKIMKKIKKAVRKMKKVVMTRMLKLKMIK